jgi:hypothetical protein
MKTKQKAKDTVLDVQGNTDQSTRLLVWCSKNLADNEYDTIVMGMFPLWYRFRFYCPKQRLMAILST